MTPTTLLRWRPFIQVEAHCDIPCGIYDPIAAKIAAQTVQKMVLRIQSLQAPGADAGAEEQAAHANTLSRYVTVKEEHAQVVKDELDILWHDYFRPDHLEKYPDLHTTFWNAAKLCSQNKVEVNVEAAQALVDAIAGIHDIFWASKGRDDVPFYTAG